MTSIHWFFSDPKDAREYHLIKEKELWLREVKGISCLREPGSGGAWASNCMSIPVLRTPRACILVLALVLGTQSKALHFQTAFHMTRTVGEFSK